MFLPYPVFARIFSPYEFSSKPSAIDNVFIDIIVDVPNDGGKVIIVFTVSLYWTDMFTSDKVRSFVPV